MITFRNDRAPTKVNITEAFHIQPKMQLTSILLLAITSTLTTALELRGYAATTCAGSYQVCQNLTPNTCCITIRNGGTAGSGSARFLGLRGGDHELTGWQRTRDGNNCGSLRSSARSATDYCMGLNPSQGQYAGFQWRFANRKRATEGWECEGTQTPDMIVSANGTEFALAGMEGGEVAALWSAVVAGEISV